VRVSWREMRAVLAALAANLGIAVVKFIAFLITMSASMLAESVHSVADTGNEVLLLIGRGRSGRPASEEHPFGFGRERYFYAFVVSVMLFTVGAAFSVYEGVHKIAHPEAIRSPLIAFIVLAVSAVLEAFSLRTAIREANHVRGDRSWGTFIRRTKSPELPVVLLEDTAALIGLGLAFAGVGLAVLTGDGRWDGAGSLAIGILLAVAAAFLAMEMKSLLIGESASPDVQRRIVAALEEGPELVRVIHLRTVHISPDSILVAAKIAVRETDSAAQIASGINTAEGRVRAAVPIATTIYLEPDLYHPDLADRTDPSIRAVQRSYSPTPPGGSGPRSPGNPENPAPADPGDPGQEKAAESLLPPRPMRPRLGPAQPRDSRRRARSFSKSRARPGVAGIRPSRRPRSATAARTGGSASTRRPNASDAGLMSYRRSRLSAAATASRSASLNCRCAGPRGAPRAAAPGAAAPGAAAPGPGDQGSGSRTGGSRPRSSR
jgi:cation diffusion facilitator family transporter